jgi:hypothetical protein
MAISRLQSEMGGVPDFWRKRLRRLAALAIKMTLAAS